MIGQNRYHNVIMSLCVVVLVAIMIFLVRLDDKHERLLDYGQFVGEYKSERTQVKADFVRIRAEMQQLRNEIDTQSAWSSSIKGNLSSLLVLMKTSQTRHIVQQMIDAHTTTTKEK